MTSRSTGRRSPRPSAPAVRSVLPQRPRARRGSAEGLLRRAGVGRRRNRRSLLRAGCQELRGPRARRRAARRPLAHPECCGGGRPKDTARCCSTVRSGPTRWLWSSGPVGRQLASIVTLEQALAALPESGSPTIVKVDAEGSDCDILARPEALEPVDVLLVEWHSSALHDRGAQAHDRVGRARDTRGRRRDEVRAM